MIGDDVVLTVAEIRGDKVRIGIEAPQHVKILRQEVADRDAREAVLQGAGEDGTGA